MDGDEKKKIENKFRHFFMERGKDRNEKYVKLKRWNKNK